MKRNIFLPIGGIVAAISPVAAVISCGSKPNAEEDFSLKPIQENKSEDLKTTVDEVKGRIYQYNVDSQISRLIIDTDKVFNVDSTLYKVTTRGSNHIVKFCVPDALYMPSKFVRKIIDEFIDKANYGYGWLSLDNVIITDARLNQGQTYVGGYQKDIVITVSPFYSLPSEVTTPFDGQDDSSKAAFKAYTDAFWNVGGFDYDAKIARQSIGGWAEANFEVLDKFAAVYAQDWNKKMQAIMDGLLETYRLHEILRMWDANAQYSTKKLLENNALGSSIYKATRRLNPRTGRTQFDPILIDQENDRIDKAFRDATQDQSIEMLKQAYGDQYNDSLLPYAEYYRPVVAFNDLYGGGNYFNNFDGQPFSTLYPYSKPMSSVEFMAVDSLYVSQSVSSIERIRVSDSSAWMYNDTSLIPFQYGVEGKKIFNEKDLSLTEDAKKLINLFGKYVYGYSKYGLKIENDSLKGFSDKDFDRVIIKNRNDIIITAVDVAKIKSHYVMRDKMFGETKLVNNSFAYDAYVGGVTIPDDAKVVFVKGDKTVFADTYQHMKFTTPE